MLGEGGKQHLCKPVEPLQWEDQQTPIPHWTDSESRGRLASLCTQLATQGGSKAAYMGQLSLLLEKTSKPLTTVEKNLSSFKLGHPKPLVFLLLMDDQASTRPVLSQGLCLSWICLIN